MTKEDDSSWIQNELNEASRSVNSRFTRKVTAHNVRGIVYSAVCALGIASVVIPIETIGKIDAGSNRPIFTEDAKKRPPTINARPIYTPTPISRSRN